METPRRELAHHAFLVREAHPAVEEPHPELREHVALQSGGHLRRGAQVGRLRLFHQRTDDVRLPARRDLGAEELVDSTPLRLGAGHGDDGLAARRQLVEHGDVEVPVQRQGQGARDRRGGHHEHIGPLALAAEGGPLGHAEAVLLIHDAEAQPLESHPFLDQRMGADDTADRAARGRREQALPGFAPDGVRQERDPDLERLQQAPQRQEVLLGQDLRRRHERGLVPRLDGGEDGEGGDDGLARAHVALEEAVHRVGLGHVGADLAPHPLLGGRERVREGAEQLPPEGPGRVHAEAALAPFALAADGETELEQEEVVEDEAAPGRGPLGIALGEVAGLERARQRLEPPPGPERFGQRLVHQIGMVVHEPLDQAPHRPLGEPPGQAVDGNQPSRVQGVVRAFLDDLVVLARQDHV